MWRGWGAGLQSQSSPNTPTGDRNSSACPRGMPLRPPPLLLLSDGSIECRHQGRPEMGARSDQLAVEASSAKPTAASSLRRAGGFVGAGRAGYGPTSSRPRKSVVGGLAGPSLALRSRVPCSRSLRAKKRRDRRLVPGTRDYSRVDSADRARLACCESGRLGCSAYVVMA